MTIKSRLANLLRSVGLKGLVESAKFRKLVGAPLYKRHLQASGSAQEGAKKERDFPITVREDDTAVVSVIVPAFNVEEYLESSVGTILSQTYTNLEVIIVNDGSSDATAALADDIARKDLRVKVIHQENQGLGAARNAGLDRATGEFVTFVDSDDEITPEAIRLMVDSLQKTGSDFVIGSIERYTSTSTWTPFWVDMVHDEPRAGITGRDFPTVVWDNIVCNKLYRRTAWDSHVGTFPVGVFYEDQEATAKLFSTGAKFDILSEVTYRWYRRDDLSSISQQKHTIPDLESRIRVAKDVYAVFEKADEEELQNAYLRKLLGDDFYTYVQQVPRAENDFYELLRSGTLELLAGASPHVLNGIAFDRRLTLEALAKADRGVLQEVLMTFEDWGGSWKTELVDGCLRAHVPGLSDAAKALQNEISEIDPDSLRPIVEVTSQAVDESGNAVFDGFAFLPTVADSQPVVISAGLIMEPATGGQSRRIALRVEGAKSKWADLTARDAFNSHEKSGFRLFVDLAAVEEATTHSHPKSTETHWTIEFTFNLGPFSWTTDNVRLKLNGSGGSLRPTGLAQNAKRLAFRHGGGHLVAVPLAPRFFLESIEETAGEVRISFIAQSSGTITDAKLYGSELELKILHGISLYEAVTCTRVGAELKWIATFDPDRLPKVLDGNSRSLDFVVKSTGALRAPVAVDKLIPLAINSRLYSFDTSTYGFLQLRQFAQFAMVDTVEVSESGRQIRLTGSAAFDGTQIRQQTPSFALVGPSTNIYPSSLEWNGSTGEYDVLFDLYRKTNSESGTRFPLGDYIFQMLQATRRRLPASVWVTCSEKLTRELPRYMGAPDSAVRLTRKLKQGALGVALVREHRPSALSQHSLYALARQYFVEDRILEDAVFFESFNGQSVSDTPKAIDGVLAAKRPEIMRYWSVEDSSVEVPGGAVPIIRYSEDWFEKLATSRYLINNNNFPHFFRKDANQVYVQTWHGTPLKKIGNDVPAQNLSLTYRQLMKREAEKYWDYLLAQSPWAGEVLRKAFGFPSDVLVLGYPRNDALMAENTGQVRSEVRRRLGVRRDQTVLLYAPTWRDNVRGANNRYAPPEYLDDSKLRKEFGDGIHVLVRAHVNTHGNKIKMASDIATDVSRYPDINDLYLAADALVTDYSSVMFDFVNTGKPIYFLAPDLVEYRDSTRGFYFDFEAEAPGPIVSSTEELIAVMKRPKRTIGDLDRRYEEFLRKYAPLDDGAAAHRLIENLFGGSTKPREVTSPSKQSSNGTARWGRRPPLPARNRPGAS